jgi:hypothetical protein
MSRYFQTLKKLQQQRDEESPNPLTLWRYQRSGASDMVPQPRHAGGSK